MGTDANVLSSPETMLQAESATILYFILIPRLLIIGFLITDTIVSTTHEDVKRILR